jgi:excisionase family DNA binding protein
VVQGSLVALYGLLMSQSSTPGRSNKRHANGNAAGLPLLLSLAQVAEVTNLSQKTISRRIQDGTLRAKRLGPRTLRVERDSVLEWLGQSA